MIRRITSILLLLMMISCFAASAETAETSNGRGQLWKPRLTLDVLAQQQRGEARLETSLFAIAPMRATDPGQPADIEKDSTQFTVALSLGAELLGPTLGSGAAAPRPFFGAAYQALPSGDRQLIQEGALGALDGPTATLGSSGLGVNLDLELSHQWRATAGLAFPYVVLDQPVQLRGSFEYLGQLVELGGTVVGIDTGAPGAEGTVFQLGWNETQAFHFIGPRLGIEAQVGRRGPFQFVGFVDVAGYFLVGDSGLEASTSSAGGTGRFRYEPESFTFQGGVGIRIAWDPNGE